MSAKSLLRYRGGGRPDSRSPESPGPRKSDNDLGLGPEPPPSEKRLQEHDSSLDEGIDDILAQNPVCKICDHNFTNTSDFLAHVRLHFGGEGGSGNRKLAPPPPQQHHPPPQQQQHPPPQHQKQQSPPLVSNGSRKRKSESQLPQVNNKVAKQSPPPPNYSPELQQQQQQQQQQPRRAPVRPQPRPHQQQQQQQIAGDNAALLNSAFELLNSQYSQEIQAQGAAAAAAQAASSFQAAGAAAAAQAASSFQAAGGGFPGFPGALHNFHAPAPFPLPHPGLFHPGYSPGVLLPPHHVPPQPPQHDQVFKCFACPSTFDRREAFVHHLQFHPQGLPPGFMPNLNPASVGQEPSQYGQGAPGGGRRQRSSPGSGGSPPHSETPGSRGHVPHVSDCTQSPRCTCRECVALRQSKKKKQVEDIDPATLRHIKKHEWERKHGYWCTKCKLRFPTQGKLVDHMSYDKGHLEIKEIRGHLEIKEPGEKKRKSSQGSVGSNQTSPSSSASSDSLNSTPSPNSVAVADFDFMSVLTPNT